MHWVGRGAGTSKDKDISWGLEKKIQKNNK
jgi:hypothetical protein